jgi:hypothetical protein
MTSNKKRRTQEHKQSVKNSKKLIKFGALLQTTLMKHRGAIPPQMVALLQRIDSNMKKHFPDMPEEMRYRYDVT